MATTSRSSRRRRTAAAKPKRSFDEFAPKTRSSSGKMCPRCGENEKAGNVGVRMNRRENDSYKQVSSRHISMCEGCCIEVYEELVRKLELD